MVDSGFTVFKVNYPETQNLAIGHGPSKRISVGEHVFFIFCHPVGCRACDNGYVSLFLWLAGEPKNIKIIFEAFVVARDGAPSSSHSNRSMEPVRVSNNGIRVWGWHRFVKRSDLTSLYAKNGVVTIVCGVIVLRDNPIAVPASDIGNHLGSLLACTDGSDSDVSFSVGGETYHAHRAVLAARSPVLKAELYGSMAESKMPCITLQDIEPATFTVLLHYMYTDRLLPRDDEKLGSSWTATELYQHVLAAADRYALDRLKLMCAQKLCDGLSVDTVAATLGHAEMHNCSELKNRCLDFFMDEKNFKKAVLTEGYLQLMHRFPSVIDEIRARIGR